MMNLAIVNLSGEGRYENRVLPSLIAEVAHASLMAVSGSAVVTINYSKRGGMIPTQTHRSRTKRANRVDTD
jgi:hypothetical protein